jgi:hypothetical protein
MANSYATEVIADTSGKFCGNALRFATEREAQIYADDLAMRWTAVRETRVVASDEPVNYRMHEIEPHRWVLERIEGVQS